MSRSRRDFLRNAALTGAGVLLADQLAWAQNAQAVTPQTPKSPNETVNFACIGVGGKGQSDTQDAGRLGNIVALCDVDENNLNKMAEKFPNAKKYSDYRRMLDEVGKDIDAVTVSTPDHHHALAASMAIMMGKNCFCQKPLTHNLYEARRIGELARQMKVATQMGNQGTADPGLRHSAALIKAGALGKVKEIHIWTNRPIWPQGQNRPAPTDPPANLAWDLWLGPAPKRPYGPGYHTFNWRGWWDFGTGALGDMACHTMNMPFMALDLRDPISVVAETTGHNHDSYPRGSVITYQFAANRQRPAIKLVWYDGVRKPTAAALGITLNEGEKFSDSGSLVVGDKGKLYTPGDYGGGGRILAGGGVEIPESDLKIIESPGHFEEFIRAIKGGVPATSNFPDYAGPLTETVLLGNLAVWVADQPGKPGKKIEWDAKNVSAKNAPEVAAMIKPSYSTGYILR